MQNQLKKQPIEYKPHPLKWNDLLKKMVNELPILRCPLNQELEDELSQAIKAFIPEREINGENKLFALDVKHDLVVFSGMSGNIHVYRVKNTDITKVCVLEGHINTVYCVELSEDQSKIFSASGDGKIFYWSRVGKEDKWVKRQEFSDHADDPRTVSWSKRHNLIATGAWENTIYLYKYLEDQDKFVDFDVMENTHGNVNIVKFSPDGTFLATGGFTDQDSNRVNVYTIGNDSVELFQGINSGHRNTVNDICFTQDNLTMVTGAFDHLAIIWKRESEDEEFESLQVISAAKEWVKSVQISLDGRVLVVSTKDHISRKYLKNEENDLFSLVYQYKSHKEEISVTRISEDGTFVYTCASDWTVKIWAPQLKKDKGQGVYDFETDSSQIKWIKISNDKSLIFLMTDNNEYQMWTFDPLASKYKKVLVDRKHLTQHPVQPWSPLNISDDAMMLAGAMNNKVKIWMRNKNKFKELAILQPCETMIMVITFFKNSYDFVIGSKDQKGYIYSFNSNLQKYKVAQVLEGHNEWVYSLYTSYDNSTLLTGSLDRSIKVWKREPDGKFKIFQNIKNAHLERIRYFEMTKDQRLFVSGSTDSAVKVFIRDSETGLYSEGQVFLNAHENKVHFFKFSQDEKYLISKGFEETSLRVWSLAGNGLIPLDSIPSVHKADLPKDFSSLVLVKGNKTEVKLRPLKMELCLQNDLSLFNVLKSIFSGSQDFINEEAFNTKMFDYINRAVLCASDVDSYYQSVILHKKINVLLLAVLSRVPGLIRKSLELYGYKPYLYSEGLDPIEVALNINHGSSLEVIASYFHNRLDQFTFFLRQDRLAACLKTSSDIFKEFVMDVFLRYTKYTEFELYEKFPLPPKGFTLIQLDSPFKNRAFKETLKYKMIELQNKKYQFKKSMYFRTMLPISFSLNSDSCQQWLKSFSSFSQDLILRKSTFMIEEIWKKNAQWLMMSLVFNTVMLTIASNLLNTLNIAGYLSLNQIESKGILEMLRS
jgi:WD40 repeat protein